MHPRAERRPTGNTISAYRANGPLAPARKMPTGCSRAAISFATAKSSPIQRARRAATWWRCLDRRWSSSTPGTPRECVGQAAPTTDSTMCESAKTTSQLGSPTPCLITLSTESPSSHSWQRPLAASPWGSLEVHFWNLENSRTAKSPQASHNEWPNEETCKETLHGLKSAFVLLVATTTSASKPSGKPRREDRVGLDERSALRLSMLHAVETGAEVASVAPTILGGATAIYEKEPTAALLPR